MNVIEYVVDNIWEIIIVPGVGLIIRYALPPVMKKYAEARNKPINELRCSIDALAEQSVKDRKMIQNLVMKIIRLETRIEMLMSGKGYPQEQEDHEQEDHE